MNVTRRHKYFVPDSLVDYPTPEFKTFGKIVFKRQSRSICHRPTTTDVDFHLRRYDVPSIFFRSPAGPSCIYSFFFPPISFRSLSPRPSPPRLRTFRYDKSYYTTNCARAYGVTADEGWPFWTRSGRPNRYKTYIFRSLVDVTRVFVFLG